MHYDQLESNRIRRNGRFLLTLIVLFCSIACWRLYLASTTLPAQSSSSTAAEQLRGANRPDRAFDGNSRSSQSSPLSSATQTRLNDLIPPPSGPNNSDEMNNGSILRTEFQVVPSHLEPVPSTQIAPVSGIEPLDPNPLQDPDGSLESQLESRSQARGAPRPYHEWSAHETAVDALGRIGAAAVPLLIETLEHPSWQRRRTAAMLLGRIGPDAGSAVPSLVKALEDPHESVRKSAARALGQIGPKAATAVEALLEMVDETAPDSPGDVE